MMPFRAGQIWPFSEDVKILENPSSVLLYLRKTKCMVTKIINYWPLDQAFFTSSTAGEDKLNAFIWCP